MNRIQSDAYQSWQLDISTVRIADLETACYGPRDPDAAKPNILLVHGIGGDRHGMMPLGYELREQFNVYFVELPGHGSTAIPSNRSAAFWWRWAAEIPTIFAAQSINFQQVIGHSSGCVAVAAMHLPAPARYVMLNPAATPTKTYTTYIRIMHVLRRLVGSWYGWYPVAFWRGLMLLRRRSRLAIDAVSWISRYTYYSKQQFYYQLDVALDWPADGLFEHIHPDMYDRVLVVAGADDTIPSEGYFELRTLLPRADVRLVPGGHLLPIESPLEMAREVAA